MRLYVFPLDCAILLQRPYTPEKCNIYSVSDESAYATLIQAIVDKNTASYTVVPSSMPVAVEMTLYHGELSDLLSEEKPKEKLEDAAISHKLALPELLEASDTRSDFYVTLRQCDALMDKKTSEKNIMVKVYVRMDTGAGVSCIWRATGPMAFPGEEYNSSVLYHQNTPVWNETLHLKIDASKFSRCHLLFVIYHASSKAAKTQPFAFGFLNLTKDGGVVIDDKVLLLCKV
jgi:hypothetical protein